MNIDPILSNHNDDDRALLEDALGDLRENILLFGETSERPSDTAFEELLRSAPFSGTEDETSLLMAYRVTIHNLAKPDLETLREAGLLIDRAKEKLHMIAELERLEDHNNVVRFRAPF